MKSGNYTNEIKAVVIAALTYVELSPEISVLVAALALFDTFTGATKAIKLGKFNFKTLALGIWVKILLLTMTYILALTAKVLGYEGAKYLSDTFMILMIAQEMFSSYNNIRSIKSNKEYEQVDLLTVFFDHLKKVAIDQIKKYEVNTKKDPD